MLKDLKKLNQNNCWNCINKKKEGINLFGLCAYFKKPKEIPSHIVDEGCRFWIDKNYIEQTELF